MLGALDFICKKSWFERGFILQISPHQYLIGQGGEEVFSQPSFGFYRQTFWTQNEANWWVPAKYSFVSRQELIDFLNLNSQISTPSFEKTSSPSFVEFQQMYYQIQNQIKQEYLQKAVPAFYEEWKGRPHLLYFLANFFKSSISSQGYLYGFWQSSQGFLGCSPEILFSVKGDSFCTMALAGTTNCLNPYFLKDQKEKKEQGYVIQSIETSLKEEVSWTKNFQKEMTYGSLKHLCQYKKGKLKKPFRFYRMIKKLHPTAALGAYPQKEGLHWLSQQPSQKKRRYFGSPVGYIHRGQAFCLVAIRGLEWQNRLIKIHSGAGIVQESSLQKEWRELFLKREQIKLAFFKNKDIHNLSEREKDTEKQIKDNR